MINRALVFPLLILVSCTAVAQVMSIPSSGFGNIGVSSLGVASGSVGLGVLSSEMLTNNLFGMLTNAQNHGGSETPSASVSKLDLKAPGKAKREYSKGFQFLMRKDYQNAVEHLKIAISIYPSFVAAHNALGSAYLGLGKTAEALGQFAEAVSLDDHLPNSYFNLGCAQLVLNQYSAAAESIKKASSIAPLDLQLQTALAYGQFMNHDYPGVLATAKQVHSRKHENAAVVHYFAAGAFEAQGQYDDSQNELNTLLKEDPKSVVAAQARQSLIEVKSEQARHAEALLHPAQPATFAFKAGAVPTSEEASRQAQRIIQDLKQKQQIAEAEATENPPACENCGPAEAQPPARAEVASNSVPGTKQLNQNRAGVLRASVDEVALFFAATDNGKPVTDLTGADVGIRDDRQPPAAILSFRNQAQLPLRLGLVIDISQSITGRFSFEQRAAIDFLQKTVTGKDDLAFVIGVNNSVLMVQDFTGDQKLISHAVDELAPSGGTALWDAVAFAADKLASRPEEQPVARILVVISDGEDNSSEATLKQALERAQHGEVAVYTVSTRENEQEEASALLGDHALKTLADLTGGTALTPGSVRRLKGSLGDLQQVIRGRYLVSYKPALFQRDGRYRTIELTAQKNGHKLRVYTRKGYYASTATTPSKSDF